MTTPRPDAVVPTPRRAAKPRKRAQARPGQGLGPQTRSDAAGARRRRPRRPRLDLRTGDVAASTGPDERADPDHPDPEHRRRERGEGLRGAARGLPVGPARRAASTRAGLGWRRPVGRRAPGLDGGRVGAAARAHRRHPAGRPRAAEGAAHPGHAAHHPRGARRPLARVPGRDAGARGARLADRHRRHRQEDGLGPAPLQLRPAADAGRPPRRSRLAPDRPHPRQGDARTRPTTTTWRCSDPSRPTRRTSTSSTTAGRCATLATPSAPPARSAPAAATWTRRRPDPRRSGAIPLLSCRA